MDIQQVEIGNILTRTSGYLETVTSHSMQPYRGCSLGSSLCGVACYVRHSFHVTRGRTWGEFLEVRHNAAESYLRHVTSERRWARKYRGRFSIFLSSSTEPFLPQEERYGVTRSLLEAMLQEPPDELVVQTHSHRVSGALDLLVPLAELCRVRCHLSIETDRDRLVDFLPNHASPIPWRFEAAKRVRAAGIRTVVTVAPLLPIADPEAFFRRIAEHADAVVLDHFVGGDGSKHGSRTRRTRLPEAMELVESGSSDPAYRDLMVAVAQRHLPGRVGVSIDGFAGRLLC